MTSDFSTPTVPPVANTAAVGDAARFEEVVSGEFDAVQAQETEPELSGKRVLQPQLDAPKLHKVLAQAGLGSRLDMETLIQQAASNTALMTVQTTSRIRW